MDNFRNYLRIKEAADLLGVSQTTLRNWDRDGKIPTRRHPMNGYRLYRRSDLEIILRKIERSEKQVRKGTKRTVAS